MNTIVFDARGGSLNPEICIRTKANNRTVKQVFQAGSIFETIRYTHNAKNQITHSFEDSDNGTDYAYDAANRLTARTWARGISTTYGYAAATGELNLIDYSDSTPDVSYSYDRMGRQTSVTDATGTRSFTYDPIALSLATETLPSTFYGDVLLTSQYEGVSGVPGRGNGYLLGTSTDADAYQSVTYGYDSAGRLASVSDGIDTFTYGYEPDSNLLASLVSPVHTMDYSYEPNRDVKTVVDNQVGGGSVSKYTYAYDEIYRRSNRQQSGSAFAQSSTDSFGYNDRSEVISSANDVLPRTEAYDFDKIGNRETADFSLGNINYTANELNQYTSISNLPSNPSHDADGNMLTTGDGWEYTWNGENRLIEARNLTQDKKLTFVYDYQGRRVAKHTFASYLGSVPAETTRFVYEGWNCIAEFNQQSSITTLQSTHLWGMDLSGSLQGAGGVGGLLKSTDDPQGTATAYYYTYDANGNVSEMLHATGAVYRHYEYDAFGNILNGAPLTDGDYAFSTKPYDADLGLYYYGYRYYDAELGRWLNRDPIVENGGVHLYGFVGNDSITSIDRFGLCTYNYSGFGRWLANVGGGKELKWCAFDNSGHYKRELDSKWKSNLLNKLKQDGMSLSCGTREEVSVSGYNSPQTIIHGTSHNAWISKFRAKINKVEKISMYKKCGECSVDITVNFEYYAWDKSDFNEGEHFGPTGRNVRKNDPRMGSKPYGGSAGRNRDPEQGIFHDDDFIWLRDNTPAGGDFDIWAYLVGRHVSTIDLSSTQ